MAEFCLDCWNKLNGRRDTAGQYVLSRNLELYEGCAQLRHVIVRARRLSRLIFFLRGPRAG